MGEIGTVGHEIAGLGGLSLRAQSGYPAFCGEVPNPVQVNASRSTQDVQGRDTLSSDRGKHAIDIRGPWTSANLYWKGRQTQRGRRRLRVPQLAQDYLSGVMQDGETRYGGSGRSQSARQRQREGESIWSVGQQSSKIDSRRA